MLVECRRYKQVSNLQIRQTANGGERPGGEESCEGDLLSRRHERLTQVDHHQSRCRRDRASRRVPVRRAKIHKDSHQATRPREDDTAIQENTGSRLLRL